MIIDSFNTDDKVLIIAELSANHGHNLKTAVETIKAAKRVGADAIKLQTYTADTMTIDSDKKYFKDVLKGTIWEGRSLYELYKEAYTPWEWHKELFHVAKEEGLICFSTPFDRTAVDFLEQFNPPAYKIASFEITDIPLIQYTASKRKPIIISTGIADLADIQLAVETCRKAGNNEICLLKCTSSYPAPLKEANLATIPNLKETFNVVPGLSDHTLGFIAPVVAVALGAKVIEKHFILDKSIGGPDATFSLDENEFRILVEAIRDAEKSIGKVSYEMTEKVVANQRFARSLFVVRDVKKGKVITEEDIKSLRPKIGMHPKYLKEIIGKVFKGDYDRGTALKEDMFE